MKYQKLPHLFYESLKDFYRNPILAIPALLVFAFLSLSSYVFLQVKYIPQSEVYFIVYNFAISIFLLLVISLFFSALIGASREAVIRKTKIRDFFFYSKRFWLKSWIIMVILLFLYQAISLISIYGAFLIGKSLSLSLFQAQTVFFAIYALGFLSVLIFFAFSNFCTIIFNLPIAGSIRASAILVKKNYLSVLLVSLVFIALNELVSLIQIPLIVNLIDSILLIPLLALVLSRFVLENRR